MDPPTFTPSASFLNNTDLNFQNIIYPTSSFISNGSGMLSFIKHEVCNMPTIADISEEYSIQTPKNKKSEKNYSKNTDSNQSISQTIIIHDNKQEKTIDQMLEDFPALQINMSTNSNSRNYTNCIKQKKNDHLNEMDHRGIRKNKKNLRKEKKFETFKLKIEGVRKNYKILSNILLGNQKKNKNSTIDHKTEFLTYSKLNDKTLIIDDEDCLTDEIPDEKEEIHKINKVKNFEEKYLIKNQKNFDRKTQKFKTYLTYNPNSMSSKNSLKMQKTKIISLAKYNIENGGKV